MKSMKTKNIKISSKKIFEQIIQAKCEWPKCNKKNSMSISLPLLEVKKGNISLKEKGVSLTAPFCHYHSILVMMSGLFGILENPEKKGEVSLYGPTGVFEIAKIVVEAMILSGDLKEQIENAERQRDENKRQAEQQKKG